MTTTAIPREIETQVQRAVAGPAGGLIEEARVDLEKRQRGDRNSLWVRSRRAWAEWLAPAVRRSKREMKPGMSKIDAQNAYG